MIVIFYLFASSRGAHHRRIRRLLLYGADSVQLMSSRVRVRYGIMTHHQSRRHEGVRHLSDPARISSLSSASFSQQAMARALIVENVTGYGLRLVAWVLWSRAVALRRFTVGSNKMRKVASDVGQKQSFFSSALIWFRS